ncbi:hypothetical protein [Aquisphaera insulae]|uniref:hypothetical protein n=1 Tax=Aquisphaera insulae TaxID=2712864 RepID=UPI0013EDD44F|nr:hypothetical protein [Aquisphaera insulae]
MKDGTPLHQLVTVSARFSRSISLVRDFEGPDALDGYILTPIGRDVLGRLQSALSGESASRAWSLTGSYGSGKSAFALLAAQLLAGESRTLERARAYLKRHDEKLWAGLFDRGAPLGGGTRRLFPILATGSRQPLDKAIASALVRVLRSIAANKGGKKPHLIGKLEHIANSSEPTGESIATLFDEANEYVGRSDENVSGVLLIIDELGKFLEYGSSHPDRGDVFALQEIAEAASRSKRPFLMLTILHQALDRYADHMSPSRRSEWAKVQGRFEDVPFEERTEQLVRLISHAIRIDGPDAETKPLKREAKSLASQVAAMDVRLGPLGKKELVACLADCFPLHPLTALTVGPLFRQLAQNERSLFAFLVSSDPHGFRDFLRLSFGDSKRPPTYRLDSLYDYVISTLGPTLYVHHRGKAWAEVYSALDRLKDASELEIKVAKVIGLLQAIGPMSPVPVTRDILQLALHGAGTEKEIDSALESLQGKSIAIFRRHLGGYSLWEGSDIDIDDRLSEARRRVERDRPMAAFLMQTVPPQPMIARRHYFQKGTLRYFEVIYADNGTLRDELTRDLGQADGRIVFCLPLNAEERKAMRSLLKSSPNFAPPSVIAALPGDMLDLSEFCYDLVCHRWVLEYTPELETDRTASKELHSRLTHVEQRLRKHMEWVFTPLASREESCEWFVKGKAEAVSTLRDVNNLLSRVCDDVYPRTPTWRNELINRRLLSSAAAAARRALIEAMILNPTVEGLGFSGVPPERCMYETLLHQSHIHRKHGDAWGFYPPDKSSDPAVRDLWAAIEVFLTETESTMLPIGQLFDIMRQPPFGLKDGVLPVILAAVLLHYDTEVALYESGSLVPRLDSTIFERMFRSPEPFAVQRFKIVGPRFDVFLKYADLLSRTSALSEAKAPNLLSLVKPLTRLVRDLPDYVRRTKQLSGVAQEVLRVIREARQPDQLLFIDIPTACGFQPFGVDAKPSNEQIAKFFEVLRAALAELQRAYPVLLNEIQRLIMEAFQKRGTIGEARQELEHDAKLITHLAVDAKLKSFLFQTYDLDSDDKTWLESVATLLAGRPPTAWDDQDRTRFEVQLTATTRAFSNFRVLGFEMKSNGVSLLNGDPEMLRVCVTLPKEGEFQRVVHVPDELRSKAKHVHAEFRRVLESEHLLDNREASVAMLAQLIQQLLSEEKKPNGKNR